MPPPKFDVSNIDNQIYRINVYLQTLGVHVYLAATKKYYLGNSKYIESNAQALEALRNSLNKEYLSIVSHYDSAFAVWTILTSPELQTSINEEEESSREDVGPKAFHPSFDDD